MTQHVLDESPQDKKSLTRRAMLTRLGLAAAAVYVAPVALELNQAKASSGSFSGRRNGRRRRRSYSRA